MREVLYLFSETEIFIFVFMEIMTKLDIVGRMIRNKATVHDKIIIAIVFGAFSIFGTYIGDKLPSGVIINIRDFGPIVAGLIGGPFVGLGAGLIGGVHRFFMGGFTNVVCGMATINAGIFCGMVHYYRKGRLVNIYQGAALALAVEFIHGALVLLLIDYPLSDRVEVIRTAIPAMMVANALGVVIAILLLRSHEEPTKESSIHESDLGE